MVSTLNKLAKYSKQWFTMSKNNIFLLVQYIIIILLSTLALFFGFLILYSLDFGETEYTQVD